MKPIQVLSDPTGRRARLVNAFGVIAIAVLVIMIIVVVIGLFRSPELNVPIKVGAISQPWVDGGARVFDPVKRSTFSALNTRALPPDAGAAQRFAFVRVKHSVAHADLIEHAVDLDGILPIS